MRRLLLLGAMLAVAGLTFAQSPEPSPALLTQMEGLELDTMDLRGLSLNDSAITRIFPAREEVAAFVSGQLDDAETQQYYRDNALVYKSFDLMAPDVDLVQVLSELLVSQIGGYYDPETKQMNTLLITGEGLADRLPLLEQIVYVHEFTHALQDANFNLGEMLGGEEDLVYSSQFPDEALARLALIEGDATEIMTQYTAFITTQRPDEVLKELDALMGLAATMTIPPGTPKILEQELTFPYTQGQVFVAALLEAGGWEMVNEAFINPPVSSEQIITPSRYIAGDMPINVELADVSDVLGDNWSQLYARTGGEFFLRRYLETRLSPFVVARAASGWGGDTYRFYVNEASETAWVWKLEWDTPEDKDQFYAAILSFVESRFPGSMPEFSRCWGNTVDAMCINDLDGAVVVTKAPTYDEAAAMRDAVAPLAVLD